MAKQKTRHRIRRFRVALMASWGLALSFGAPAQAVESNLPFHWPSNTSVPVHYSGLKKGNTFEAAFELRIGINSEDKTYSISRQNFELKKLNGQALTKAEIKAALAPVQAIMGYTPTFRISEDGTLTAIEDFDYDAILDWLGKTTAGTEKSDSDGQMNKIFEQMKTPQMRQMINAKIAEEWSYWVDLWRYGPTVEGTAQVLPMQINIYDSEVDQQITIRHKGTAPQCPTCARFVAEVETDKQQLRAAMIDMMLSIAGAPSKRAEIEAAFIDIDQINHMEAVIDTKTLQPYAVSTSQRTVITGKDNQPQEKIEEKSWIFDWPK